MSTPEQTSSQATSISADKPIALVLGGTQGIGLALVIDLLQGKSASTIFPKDGIVVATARDPKSRRLLELQEEFPTRLFIEVVDVLDDVSVDTFINTMNTKYPRLDIYIHNSGVVLDDATSKVPGFIDKQAYFKTHAINVLAPQTIFYGLVPLLNRTHLMCSNGIPSDLNRRPRPLIDNPKKDATTHVRCIFMSSILSSMQLHTFYSVPAYRTSKAALNHIVKDMALSHRHLSINVFHPGYVQTTLTAGNGNIMPEESAQGILTVLSNEGYSINNCKAIMSYDGNHLPW